MFQNPHVLKVHIPGHMLGFAALIYSLSTLNWIAPLSFIVFNLWFSGIGMSVGFHRYFTHKAFKVNRFWHHAMLWGGTLAGQGSAIFWAALHRLHHSTADTPSDIHTPTNKGLWNAYMGWIFTLNPNDVSLSRANDLVKDKWCRFSHRNYHRVLWTWWALLIGLSLLWPAFIPVAAGALVAGMWSIHQEAWINSFCHTSSFGTRDYETKDSSVNIKWLSWLTWGQSLHNNHHAFPKEADFSLGQIDPGYEIIKRISIDLTK